MEKFIGQGVGIYLSIAIVSADVQKLLIFQNSIHCAELIQQELNYSTDGRCGRVWDGVLCWPMTSNGTTETLRCPDYVNGFKIDENATRYCDSNGEWWINPELNETWTNLTLCISNTRGNNFEAPPEIFESHMDKIRLMYNIGYGISLVFLLMAVTIMLYFRRLHCPRNTVHINLFFSFILRAIVSFIKEKYVVGGVGFASDVERSPDGGYIFLENGSHWQCKVFFSLFNYILGANYMWIYAEGIYLHMLITVAMFSEKSGVKKLILFGWGAPVIFVLPWVFIRATLEDELCWNTHPTPGYFWMIRGPIVAAMAINFIIFLNIIRVLFTKLNAFKTPDAKRSRYRKLAKSTLVLIPLFGVHYIVFIGLPDNVDETTELVKLYYEMFFNSFQGFFVSLLFCFLNGEVQTEIRKKWRRFKLRREGSSVNRRLTRDTSVTFFTKARGSVASAIINNDNQNGRKHSMVEMEYLKNKQVTLADKDHMNHVTTNGNVAHAHSNITSGNDVDNSYREQLTPLNQYSTHNPCNLESQSLVNNQRRKQDDEVG